MKVRLIFVLFSILLSSCAPTTTSSLWGEHSSPTPEIMPTVGATQIPQNTPTLHISSSKTATPLITRTPFSTTAPPTRVSSIDDATITPPYFYYSQSGDTLEIIATHFSVEVDEITSALALPESHILLNPETLLVIPNRLAETTLDEQFLPDSEFTFSATAIDFDTIAYIDNAGGYISNYREYLGSTGWTTGAEGIARLALENSINPRLLVALVEYQSGWVLGHPSNLAEDDFPLGYQNSMQRGLFRQMMLAVQDLTVGYYSWRDGSLTELTFPDGTTQRIAPDLNAGSVAIQYFFSKHLDPELWAQTVDPRVGFPALYTDMFGDPWTRAHALEPLFPPNLQQPELNLPFDIGVPWSYTGGPHSAWEHEGAIAALDFAPASAETGCAVSNKWVTASAAGLVVRSGQGAVVLDLDGDGHEQTGWNLLYMHIAKDGRVPLGTWLDVDDHIGHPSCEGGVSTGTHLHFARKFNGEWILADGPLPFNLNGWIAHNGERPYLGTLTRNDYTIFASQVGELKSQIYRDSLPEE